jgi:hypothetical protein
MEFKLAVILLLFAELCMGDNISQFIRDLKIATGAPRFQCIICGHTAKDKSNLRKHVSYVHGSNNEEMCKVCHKVYKNKSSLRNHLRQKTCTKKLVSLIQN